MRRALGVALILVFTVLAALSLLTGTIIDGRDPPSSQCSRSSPPTEGGPFFENTRVQGYPTCFPLGMVCTYDVDGDEFGPQCIPPVFYLVVNLPLVWIAGPLAALLSRRYRLAGLFLWGVIGVNAVVHIVPAIVQREYDPGLVTAIILFIPLTAMTAVAVVGRRGAYRRRAGAMIIATGGLLHAVLAGTALLFLRGVIPEWVLLAAQPAVIVVGYLILRSGERRVLKP